ncbi:glycosyltransferase [Tessaracoccus sp. O5.2]|uniref:glycosyltransferase family protein n=1 Tax=Tessaracoccus sp. O5.2 TaxID=3157622 RepID=UPI0036DA7A93
MMQESTAALAQVRTALWHLRAGGVGQLREFLRRRRRPGAGRPDRLFKRTDGRLSFQPWRYPEAEPRRRLRVGIIADAFTLGSFRYEWHQVRLSPDAWREQLDAEDLDLLFVESAWAGNEEAWQGHLTGTSAPRPAVVELAAEARRRGIPSVFWNKEDPTHFEDFLDTAALFDWVFTTDAECVPAYRERLGHDRVGVIPFAVADRVCNPVRMSREHQPRGIAFAGTWFAHKYPERREQMRLLFDAALNAETEDVKFDIFSRFLDHDEKYQFPEPYASHVVGSLDYDQMLSAYRSYKVFLNVNTVTTSPTMFARRVLEITACGTPVVSTPAPSLAAFLGDGVAQVSIPAEAESAIGSLVTDEMARARMVHVGQRELWKAHTYGHRVDTILESVGIPNEPVRLPTVSALVATNRPHQIDHVLASVAAQRDVNLQLLVATHNFEDRDVAAKARALGIENVTVLQMGTDDTLGDCLNALLDRADGEVVSKMDDDDWYGPDYLADLLRAMRYSDAEVVGKHCRFVHLAARDVTVLTQEVNEHRYTHFVAGPTLTAARDLARTLRFAPRTRGEDSDFLKRALAEGGRIYAADRFNFVQWRSGRPEDHTWTADDESFLKAEVHLPGLPLATIEL